MRTKLFLLASSVALSLAAPANAGHFKGWYIGLEGGGNWVSDNDAIFSTTPPPGSGPARIDFDTGWAGIATAGYGFDSNWRIEAELGYRHNDVNVSGVVNRTGGELDSATLMGNVLYDIPVTERLTLSVGAGAGVMRARFDDGVMHRDDDTKFAYQGLAEVSYALNRRLDLTLNYRYLRTDDAEFHGRHLTQTDSYDTDNLQNQTVTVGLRYDLYPDEEHAAVVAAPPPMAEAAPPPPPPSAPKQFLVFFGFNKSNLTQEAQKVVTDAAAAAKEFGSATIVVVGHADTSGSKEYNQRLSERRANTVRTALSSQGIDASKITASGRGETELLVQTGDGVKEPQNRRASIDLQ